LRQETGPVPPHKVVTKPPLATRCSKDDVLTPPIMPVPGWSFLTEDAVLVGYAWFGSDATHPYCWTAAGGFQDLGNLGATASSNDRAYGFRWVAGVGMEELPRPTAHRARRRCVCSCRGTQRGRHMGPLLDNWKLQRSELPRAGHQRVELELARFLARLGRRARALPVRERCRFATPCALSA
jgi:hypothetical protein